MKLFCLRLSCILGVILLLLGVLGALFIRFGIYHPRNTEFVEIYKIDGLTPQPLGETFKVLSYNVQYFAGKDFVFFYDVDGFKGPDTRPSTDAIDATLTNISNLILEFDPDVILLQEIDDGAARTDNKDQSKQLLERLKGRYPYYAEAFYWKAIYVPHPKIAGSVGMKLTTLSKAPITKAIRHQLPRIKENPISKAFNFKRAILETHIQGEKGQSIAFLNTHLDAFAHDPGTMQKQVYKVDQVLSRLESENVPWLIGGDFNLLPPGMRDHFADHVAESYSEESEIKVLFDKYHSIPRLEDLQASSIDAWLTHFPNNPTVNKPDRIIDYYFYGSKVSTAGTPEVIQGETWTYSDHLPIVATFRIQ